jgi:putative ATP-binding cassette transporter
VTEAARLSLFDRRFFASLARLTRPYWTSPEARTGWALFAGILVLELGAVFGIVQLSNVQRRIYDALQGKDAAAFFRALAMFFGIALVYLLVAAYKNYARQALEIRWRRWLTDHHIARWLSAQAYYRLELRRDRSDNPDQRIAEDVRDFVGSALSLFFDFFGSVVTLVSFVAILWTLSGAFEFHLGGTAWHLPGYMVWVALGYATLSTAITHRVGRKLVPLHFDQQRYEADFRFHLVRLRENAEAVAFQRGEAGESQAASGRFHRVVENWWRLITAQKNLALATLGFAQANAIVPLLAAAPGYFAGSITLGDVMQTVVAYAQVSGALTWFVGAYAELASWRASVGRLAGFDEAVDAARAEASRDDGIEQIAGTGDALALDDLRVDLPDGRVLLDGVRARIEPGERIAIAGPSGVGKSTLFRALAGIWPYGAGRIERPRDARTQFLPQRPYLPIGTLRAVLSYPSPESVVPDDRIREALGAFGLGDLAERLDESAHWAQRLSGGEQQRVALARALLHEPAWLFLDEATAALDPAAEQRAYELLRERLPHAAIISIAHRGEVARHHDRHWRLMPGILEIERAA